LTYNTRTQIDIGPMTLQSTPTSYDHDARYDAALFEYSAGSLPAGPAFVVASHLALRPQARALVGVFDAAGGSLLDALEPVALTPPAWLKEGAPEPTLRVRESYDMAHVLSSLDEGRWKRNLAGMLTKPVPGVDAQLLKLEAGRNVPHHGHKGLEFTLVLAGSFDDGHGVYRRGDLVVHDEDSEHQPRAAAGANCICLISQTAPVRLSGALGWVLNRFSS
jgi:putative transcriptional regulator